MRRNVSKKALKLAKYTSRCDAACQVRVAFVHCGNENRREVARPALAATISAMPLLENIQKDMVEAMKARDESRLSALRMIKTALQKHQIDSMKPLVEAAELQVMNTLLKQRREAADLFRKGGREELAAKEEAEIVVIESYLPSAPTPAEMEQAISTAIAETGATSQKQMGIVMKAAQTKLAGKRVDGKVLSELVKHRLA